MKSDKEEEVPSRRHLFVRIAKGLGVALLGLLLFMISLQLIFKYFSDEIIGTVLKGVVTLQSDNLYGLSYGEIELNFVKNELSISDLLVEIDTAVYSNLTAEEQSRVRLKTIRIPEVKVADKGVSRFFFQEYLRLQYVLVEAPEIELYAVDSASIDTVATELPGDLYPYISSYLKGLSIDDVAIEGASVHIHPRIGGTAEVLSLKSLSTNLTNFVIDAHSGGPDGALPFSVVGAEMRIGKGNAAFTTENTSFQLDELSISSNESSITLRGVHFYSLSKGSNKEAVRLVIPYLQISGIDFKKAYLHKLLDIEQILIQTPNVAVDQTLKRSKLPNFYDSEALYQLLSPYFKSYHVGRLLLQEASLELWGLWNEERKKYQLDDFDIDINNWRLDSSTTPAHGKQFYAEDVGITIRDYAVLLKDSLHYFQCGTINLSTSQSRAEMRDIAITANISKGQFSRLRGTAKNLYEARIPQFELTGIDLWRLYLDRYLTIDNLQMNGANVEVFNKANFEKASRTEFDLWNMYPLISDDLMAVEVRHFQLNKAIFNFTKDKGNRQSSLLVRNISLELDSFQLDSNSYLNEKKLFYSDGFRGRSEGIELLLSDSIHAMRLEKIEASTYSASFSASKFELQPLLADTVLADLTDSIHTNFFNLHLNELNLAGIDFQRAWYQQDVRVDLVKFDQPNTRIFGNSSYKKSQVDTVQKLKIAFLSNYFQSILIKELELDSGLLQFFVNLDDTIPRLSTSDISLCIADLSIDTAALHRNELLLKTRDIDFSASNYSFLLGDGVHVVDIRDVRTFGADAELYANNFHLHPLEKYKNLGNHDLFDVSIPMVSLIGMDLQKAIVNRNLGVRNLSLKQPKIDVWLFNDGQKKNGTGLESVADRFQKVFTRLGVGNIAVEQGELDIIIHQDSDDGKDTSGATIIMHADEFWLNAQQLNIDSTSDWAPGTIFYTDDMDLRLQNFSRKSSTGNHTLLVKELNLSTADGSVRVDSLSIVPDSGLYARALRTGVVEEQVIAAEFPKMEFEGFSFYNLLINNALKVDSVGISTPHVQVFAPDKQEKGPFTFHSDSIYPWLSPVFESYAIGQLEMEHAAIDYNDHKAEPVCFYNMSIGIDSFEVDSTLAVLDSTNLLHTKDVRLELLDYAMLSEDGMFQYAFDKATLSLAESEIQVDSFRLTPMSGKAEFSKQLDFQSDWMKATNGLLSLKKIDFEQMLNEQKLVAGNLLISGLDMEVYRDKRLPLPENRRPKMPQETIRDLGFYLKLDSVHMEKSNVTYKEFATKGKQEGYITIENINAHVANISNDSSFLARGIKTPVTASALIMGEGLLTANFEFDLDDPLGQYTFGGTMYSLDIESLNPMLENVVFVKIKSGIAKRVDFNVEANSYFARGRMKFLYNNLHVSLLDKETLKKGLDERMGSFLANTFVLKSNNPRFFIPRKGKIFYIRDTSRSIFHYWARISLVGLQSSAETKLLIKKTKKKEVEGLSGGTSDAQ